MTDKVGILLLNIGTPDAPTVASVRKFLRQFLSDRRVIDLPWIMRQLILNCFVLPFRPQKTAKLYQKIWTEHGSPLLYNSELFKNKLAKFLGDKYHVALGMCYGTPSIRSAVAELAQANCSKIIIFPLYPKYSEDASGAAIAAAKKTILERKQPISFSVCKNFFNDSAYQQAMTNSIQHVLQTNNPDFVLFSYHGLPERQLAKAGCDESACDRINSCLSQKPNIKSCYRAQCFATTQAVADRLNLTEQQFCSVFQSRLGRVQWIRPYADKTLENLSVRGVKRLMVVCPSFVADCLETLEEINIRAKKQWQLLGGEEFTMVPCLNADPEWVCAAAEIVKSDSFR